MKTFNVLYKGRALFKNLSHEECAEVLEEFSQKYYEDEEFDIQQLELEEI